MVAGRLRIVRRELEFDEVAMTMETRLALGASRIDQPRESAATASALRADQARVFADFATYLTDVATRPPAEQRAPFCRIILPPRTGKTVVAGHIMTAQSSPRRSSCQRERCSSRPCASWSSRSP